MGSLAHGDSEGALFEEGAQAGVSDKGLGGYPHMHGRGSGDFGLSVLTHACLGDVCEGFLVLTLGQSML